MRLDLGFRVIFAIGTFVMDDNGNIGIGREIVTFDVPAGDDNTGNEGGAC